MLDTSVKVESTEVECGDELELKKMSTTNAHRIGQTTVRTGLCGNEAEAPLRKADVSVNKGDLTTVHSGDAHMKRSNVAAIGADAETLLNDKPLIAFATKQMRMKCIAPHGHALSVESVIVWNMSSTLACTLMSLVSIVSDGKEKSTPALKSNQPSVNVLSELRATAIIGSARNGEL